MAIPYIPVYSFSPLAQKGSLVFTKYKTPLPTIHWDNSKTAIWDNRIEDEIKKAKEENGDRITTLNFSAILSKYYLGTDDMFASISDLALGTAFFEENPSFLLPSYDRYENTQRLNTVSGYITHYAPDPFGGVVTNPASSNYKVENLYSYFNMSGWTVGYPEDSDIFTDGPEVNSINLSSKPIFQITHRFLYSFKIISSIDNIESWAIIATSPSLSFPIAEYVDFDEVESWDKLYEGEYCLAKQMPVALSRTFTLNGVPKASGDVSYGGYVDPSTIPGFQSGDTTYIPTEGGGIAGENSPSGEGIEGGSSGSGSAPSGGSSDSPFSPGGGTAPTPGVPSNPGNSPGTWQTGGATIDTTPSSSNILNSGLIRAYAMSDEQVKHFASELWSDNILDQLAKWLDNPMDVVLSLTQFPFEIYRFSGSDVVIKFNWLNNWDTNSRVLGAPLNRQYSTLDFGTITVPRYSGTFYDFQPYTQAHCYIPYVGFVPIKASEVVGSTLRLTYTVDCIFGNAVANLISGKYGCIGTYNCTVGVQVPLTSRNMMQLYTGILKAAVTVATAGVGAGLGAAETSLASSASSQILQASNAVSDFAAIGAPEVGATAANAHLKIAQMYSNESASVGAARGRILSGGQSAVNYINSAQSALNGVISSNAPIQRSGSFDALSGRLSSQNGYLVLSIPHQNYPGINYDTTIGFPSNIQGNVGNFYGYTKFRSVEVKCSRATISEIEEIQNILQGGIINANLYDKNYYA